MASSSVSENAASPMLSHRTMGSHGHHQASISSEDEYPHLPCKNPIRFHINVVKIGRSAICLFAFIDIFLVAFTEKTPITVPLVLLLIAVMLFNTYQLAGHFMPRGSRFKAPFFSFQLLCIKVTCGGGDSDDESQPLLSSLEWLNDDPKKRRGIWKELFDITLAVVIGILAIVHMNNRQYYQLRYWDYDFEACVTSYVFTWLIVAFELIVVFLEVFRIFRGATVFLCPDEDVEGHAQQQIRLPASPPVMISRGGDHVSIVA
ncbi:hypothetical protein PspLS_03654 [Pyricularia sp. CBS 133598]|nr:hypothetical protein PspLS_03654 [Pyricularia sp. CBS 133598]